MDKKVYTVQEAAEFLKIRDYTIREWLRTGNLKGFKAGRVWRIHEDELTKLIERGLR